MNAEPAGREADARFMARALELARKGEGLTRPNPPVGAVLVLDGRIIAEGFHERAGGPHAERVCLDRTDLPPEVLRRAALYVTLEPCSTKGRTPPCTDLILERGVGRVVAAVEDPNPRHAGRGLDLLRRAGVDVTSGVCAREAAELLAPFAKFITRGMPFLTLKLAVTLDGRIADAAGRSKWITGPAARGRVQALRRRADVVMVGAGTVRADNPSLLPRPDEGRRPWRVVVGENIPPDARVLTDEAAGRTLVRSGDDLPALLRELAAEYDVMHVLCEGGGKLAASLVAAGLVDEYFFFVAPKLLGGDGVPCLAPLGRMLSDAAELEFLSVERLGPDLLVRARPVSSGDGTAGERP